MVSWVVPVVGAGGVLLGAVLTALLTARRDYQSWLRQEQLALFADVLRLADLREGEPGWESGLAGKMSSRVLLVAPHLRDDMTALMNASLPEHRATDYLSARDDFARAALAQVHGRRRARHLGRTLTARRPTS